MIEHPGLVCFKPNLLIYGYYYRKLVAYAVFDMHEVFTSEAETSNDEI